MAGTEATRNSAHQKPRAGASGVTSATTFTKMTDFGNSIIERITYEQPERGWTMENKEHVKSIIFKFERPVEVDGVVSDEWVMLVEPRILDQIQIVSIDRNTPVGWKLDEKVYDSSPAHDKEAIKWLAQNYSLLDR